MDERQPRLIKRSHSSFLINGSRNSYMCTHRHSQALDDTLKLQGLTPEGVISAVDPDRSHHLGTLVPNY